LLRVASVCERCMVGVRYGGRVLAFPGCVGAWAGTVRGLERCAGWNGARAGTVRG
jgi:hypothetical protein